MVPILIPLIINSIKRAFSIAEALESKAFGTMATRTNYFELKMRKRDYIIIGMMIAFVIAIFTIFFAGLVPIFFNFNLKYFFPDLYL